MKAALLAATVLVVATSAHAQTAAPTPAIPAPSSQSPLSPR